MGQLIFAGVGTLWAFCWICFAAMIYSSREDLAKERLDWDDLFWFIFLLIACPVLIFCAALKGWEK